MFEKVTLSLDQKADQKVVKIGFLNIATNHWITVNDQGIVTLQVNLYNNQILNCRTRLCDFMFWKRDRAKFLFFRGSYFFGYVYVRETDLGHVVQKSVYWVTF